MVEKDPRARRPLSGAGFLFLVAEFSDPRNPSKRPLLARVKGFRKRSVRIREVQRPFILLGPLKHGATEELRDVGDSWLWVRGVFYIGQTLEIWTMLETLRCVDCVKNFCSML